MGTLYDTDIVAWAAEQAEILRARQWNALDLEHIAEEIEDVGKHEKSELGSRFAVLIAHLLKWKFQPGRRGKSWTATIKVQRARAARRLARTPSLKHCVTDNEWVQDAWDDALVIVIAETGIDVLPLYPIWTVDEILDPAFLPD